MERKQEWTRLHITKSSPLPRLVSDVVTGKLDVRDAAAKLPVEEQTIEPEELVDEVSEAMEDEMTEPVA